MKITIAQLNPVIGDLEGNFKSLKKAVKEAATAKSDLIIFSELFLTGYPPQDLLERSSFIRDIEQYIQKIADLSKNNPGLGILLGTPSKHANGSGTGLYNSAFVFLAGEIIFKTHKSLLPTYDVFEETRYFDSSEKKPILEFKGQKLGITICEDAWFQELEKQPRYTFNPIAELENKNIDIIINISASPFHIAKETTRFDLFRNIAVKNKALLIFVNQVGGNDELVFDGKSMLINPFGEVLYKGPAFQEEITTLDLNKLNQTSSFNPQNILESIYQALIMGIKDYLQKCGFSKAVIGLSGGIDSAIVCVLAVAALGKENVIGITMPSKYSSEGSVSDSQELAANLGIKLHIAPIKSMYNTVVTELADLFKNTKENVAEENIQARLRGNILMAYSNKFGHIVLTTGNKSELAVGYCTLYGDMCGGLAVISDLPKTLVYKLANYINQAQTIIPESIITKAPSAELRPDQKDQDTLPEYEILDKILQYYIEDQLSATEIIQKGFAAEIVNWVVRMVKINEYKRKQAAPGIRITSKAFGVGRRMMVTSRYNN